jgi:hypothetical protein
MKSLHRIMLGVLALAAVLGGATATLAQSRTVGQVIDDTTITAETKARLTADRLSNLTQIGVSTRNGIVTLTGTVDSLERQARAVQIAGAVQGVKSVVNNIQVASAPGTTPPIASPPVAPTVDVTGVVSQADPATGTINLQDGRVLRLTDETSLWQPTTIQALRPGSQLIVRSATPVTVRAGSSGEWRMGTVKTVEPTALQMILTDGAVVRVSPLVNIRRGGARLTLEQIVPGSEVVIRPIAPSPAGTEGSASPGPVQSTAVIDAAEINVVWMPSSGSR